MSSELIDFNAMLDEGGADAPPSAANPAPEATPPPAGLTSGGDGMGGDTNLGGNPPATPPDVATGTGSAQTAPADPAKAPGTEPAPATVPEPAPPAGGTPPAPVPPPVAGRVRTNRMSDLNKLTVTILGENPDMDPETAAETARQYLGQPSKVGASAQAPGQGTAQAPAADSPEQAQDPQTVDEYDAALADLEQQLREAGSAEGLFTSEIADLQMQHSRLAAERALAAHAESQQMDAQELAWRQASDASKVRAQAMHPDVVNPESVLGRAISQVIDELSDAGDPLLDSVHRFETITALAMSRAGLSPVSATAATPAAAPAPAAAPSPAPAAAPQQLPAPTAVPPLLSGTGTSSQAATVSPGDLEKILANMSADDLDIVLGGGQPPGRAPIIR